MAGFKHLVTTLLVCSLASIGLAEYIMVCYYTNWAQYRNGVGKFMPKDIDPNLCTHIIYAFGKLDGNKITNFEWNDNDDYINLYKQVNEHKAANPNLKTLLAMGGWTAGSLIYSNMASTAANRKEFIDSAIDWLRKYNFDGLDMDWEYPANRDGKPYDKENFAHLCKETREAFDNEAQTTGRDRLLFTSAVGAGKAVVDSAYDVPVMAQYMDFICIMSYDLHGSWESFTGLHTGLDASDADSDKTLNVMFAANYWHQKGAPRNKLIIGLGTYGRSFTLVDASNHGVGAPASGAGAPGTYTREKGFLSYYEICEMRKNGGTTYRDPVAKVPYYVNPNTKLWVGYDDKESIYAKLTELIIKDGYGGAMTWALDLDDFTGTICGEGKYPLISLMKNVLDQANGGGTVKPPTTKEPGTNPPTNAPTNAPTTTRAPSVTTPGGGGADGICAQSYHGYIFPNVNDCSSFYQCVHGRAVVIQCQSGLLFNVATDNCDWPSNVVCASTTQAPVTAVPTTQAPVTAVPTTQAPVTAVPTTQAPVTVVPTTIIPSSSKPSSMAPTTPTPAGSGFCSTASNGLHPDPLDCAQYYNCWNGAGSCEGGAHYLAHPTDCTKFYQCSHGVGKEIDCTPGLHFSVQHRTCPYDGAIRDPTDCAKYYLCWNGVVLRQPKSCSSGMLFSSVTKLCDRAGISCTNNEGKLYPYSNDCTKYIQCVHGSPLTTSASSPKPTDAPSIMESTDNASPDDNI
uniref:Acidic mammalian chitinase n=1 Tax=Magallana gigas TaxID=29159 RepID=K1QQW5_MAGGI